MPSGKPFRSPNLALALAACCIAAHAQPAVAPADTAKKARIEGTVVSSTGQPIAQATLTLGGILATLGSNQTRPPTQSATSDAAGKFAIENVDPGLLYSLGVQKTGFSNSGYGVRSPNSSPVRFTLRPGEELKGIALVMTPTSAISGRVTDSNGNPVQNAEVSVLRRSSFLGARSVSTSRTANSDDKGEYRIANLAPGHYYIAASPPTSRNPHFDAVEASNIRTFYPSSIDIQAAVAIKVEGGDQPQDIDIQFRTGKTFTIRATPVNNETGAVVDMYLRATPKDDPSQDPYEIARATPSLIRNADGSREIQNLRPGTYFLEPTPGRPVLVGRMELTITDKDLDGVILPLSQGATITGSVRNEDGDLGPLIGSNISLTQTQGVSSGGPRATINPDGSFRIERIAPTQYFTSFSLPDGYYLKAATFDNVDLIRNPLNLTSGTGGTIQFLVADKPEPSAGRL